MKTRLDPVVRGKDRPASFLKTAQKIQWQIGSLSERSGATILRVKGVTNGRILNRMSGFRALPVPGLVLVRRREAFRGDLNAV